MKYGKIYTWTNREEARHLIGKKVLFSDSLKGITEEDKGKIGVLEDIRDRDMSFIYKVTGLVGYLYIREIEEAEELMTHEQLAEWCGRGFGCWTIGLNDTSVVYDEYGYAYRLRNEPVDKLSKIRRWGSNEWIKPTKSVYEQDCKEKIE